MGLCPVHSRRCPIRVGYATAAIAGGPAAAHLPLPGYGLDHSTAALVNSRPMRGEAFAANAVRGWQVFDQTRLRSRLEALMRRRLVSYPLTNCGSLAVNPGCFTCLGPTNSSRTAPTTGPAGGKLLGFRRVCKIPAIREHSRKLQVRCRADRDTVPQTPVPAFGLIDRA